MNPASILVVEDDIDILELLRFNLEREQFRVSTATTGELGIDKAISEPPSLIVLDLALPGIQGLEVCRILKQRTETRHIPVLMLTAKGEESDVVVGLEFGADDYVVKPFKVRELVARIRAVLRRGAQVAESPVLSAGGVEIDTRSHDASYEGNPLALTPAEFRLLRALVANRGKVMSRDELVTAVTEGSAFITERNIDVHVRGIRRKLGNGQVLLTTIRGVGYKFN